RARRQRRPLSSRAAAATTSLLACGGSDGEVVEHDARCRARTPGARRAHYSRAAAATAGS
ncbi:MAG: hypothetical protein R3A52_27310, partial [Polyangiales bacterium]